MTAGELESAVPARLLPLLDGEHRALKFVEGRDSIDLATNDLCGDDPANAGSWASDRQLRGAFLQWLLTEGGLDARLPAARLVIRGAKIIGALDLSFQTISLYLFFQECFMFL